VSEPVKHLLTDELDGYVRINNAVISIWVGKAAAELDRLAALEAKWAECEGLEWVICGSCRGTGKGPDTKIVNFDGSLTIEKRKCIYCLGTGKRLRAGREKEADHAGPDAG